MKLIVTMLFIVTLVMASLDISQASRGLPVNSKQDSANTKTNKSVHDGYDKLQSLAWLAQNRETFKEQPVRVDVYGTQEVPVGYHRVAIHFRSPEKAKAIWLRETGSMNGYSLDKVNQITLIAPIAVAPCACHMPAWPANYVYTKGNPPDCEESC